MGLKELYKADLDKKLAGKRRRAARLIAESEKLTVEADALEAEIASFVADEDAYADVKIQEAATLAAEASSRIKRRD
jgi:hypothetical protein